MPPQSGQSLATWLMFIPLLVVPAVAIFGVPQFSRVSSQADSAQADEPELTLGSSDASPFEGDLAPFPNDRVESGRKNSARNAREPQPSFRSDDPFSNPGSLNSFDSEPSDAPKFADTSEPSSAPVFNGPSAGDPFTAPTPEFSDPNRAERLPASESFTRTPDSTRTRTAEVETDPEEQLSWRKAISRLNQLGVSQYSLEPSSEPYLFRFTCDFTPEDNPRLTHRFEAEAGEPLRAVQKTIAQVELWLSQRNKP